MRIRGRKPAPAVNNSVSAPSPSSSSSSSSSSSPSAASSSSSITATHSSLASSQDSSTSSPFSLFSATGHRCHGLDLLVKAIHQVTAGSAIGVPYIQRRVTIRRRRRDLQFDASLFSHLFEQNKIEQNTSNKKKRKNPIPAQRQKRGMGLPSKFQDSVLQPWARRSAAGGELGL